jgi:hypothetical protein
LSAARFGRLFRSRVVFFSFVCVFAVSGVVSIPSATLCNIVSVVAAGVVPFFPLVRPVLMRCSFVRSRARFPVRVGAPRASLSQTAKKQTAAASLSVHFSFPAAPP